MFTFIAAVNFLKLNVAYVQVACFQRFSCELNIYSLKGQKQFYLTEK